VRSVSSSDSSGSSLSSSTSVHPIDFTLGVYREPEEVQCRVWALANCETFRSGPLCTQRGVLLEESPINMRRVWSCQDERFSGKPRANSGGRSGMAAANVSQNVELTFLKTESSALENWIGRISTFGLEKHFYRGSLLCPWPALQRYPRFLQSVHKNIWYNSSAKLPNRPLSTSY